SAAAASRSGRGGSRILRAAGGACFVFILADRRRPNRPSLDARQLCSVLFLNRLSADAASLVLAGRGVIRADGRAELPLRLFCAGQCQAVTAGGIERQR